MRSEGSQLGFVGYCLDNSVCVGTGLHVGNFRKPYMAESDLYMRYVAKVH